MRTVEWCFYHLQLGSATYNFVHNSFGVLPWILRYRICPNISETFNWGCLQILGSLLNLLLNLHRDFLLPFRRLHRFTVETGRTSPSRDWSYALLSWTAVFKRTICTEINKTNFFEEFNHARELILILQQQNLPIAHVPLGEPVTRLCSFFWRATLGPLKSIQHCEG